MTAAGPTVTIYHNPRCSKSRATLALLQSRGIRPRVIEYLKEPPSAEGLSEIVAMLGMTPRQLLRPKDAAAAGLDDPALDDAALIAGMIANPIVIERPIVLSAGRARIGRPPEAVLDILE
ncbi:MAG: arsenate reductase (glutaredoxin) [Rhodospirillales bacterium]|nr:MAG: arsenate reductase (glutaredoxin) [Rhodospirillales bacterium]